MAVRCLGVEGQTGHHRRHVTVEKRPVSEVSGPMASLGRGSASCWPATGPRVRRRSSRGPGARRPPSGRDLPGTQPSSSSGSARSWPGRGWTPGRRPSPASAAAQPGQGLARDRQPDPLSRHSQVTSDPSKRSKSSYTRFAAEMPNECWQSDFTHYPLAGGADTEILTWPGDHSRYALSLTAHHRVTGPAVLLAFRAACGQHGIPASTLTDNGMVFTTRLSGGRGGRNALEHELRRLGITQKNGKPNHL
jgi:transposase InsO family protein